MSTNHTRREMLRVVRAIAKSFGGRLSDWRGWTVGEALREIDRAPVNVYWGCWTESDLAMVV